MQNIIQSGRLLKGIGNKYTFIDWVRMQHAFCLHQRINHLSERLRVSLYKDISYCMCIALQYDSCRSVALRSLKVRIGTISRLFKTGELQICSYTVCMHMSACTGTLMVSSHGNGLGEDILDMVCDDAVLSI